MGGKNSKRGTEAEQEASRETSNSSTMIKSIAVLIAMTEEAEPRIKDRELSAPVPGGSPRGCMRYCGKRNGAEVNVVVFGKDKVYNTGACFMTFACCCCCSHCSWITLAYHEKVVFVVYD